jgi:hypothetical protein
MAQVNEGSHADQKTTGRTVVGLFSDRARAEAAIRELKGSGFADEQIGIATEEGKGHRLVGALAGMGVPELDAGHFKGGLGSGGTLVTVDAGPRTREALALLERHGMDFGPSGLARYGSSSLTASREAYTGRERRSWRDPAYAGPERRLVAVRL